MKNSRFTASLKILKADGLPKELVNREVAAAGESADSGQPLRAFNEF